MSVSLETTAVGTPPTSEAEPDPKRWLALVVIAVSQLMVVLDASIVNIALPDAQKSLHISSLSSAQWVVTAYTLAFGGLLLVGGRIADYAGRKRVFIIGLLGFAASSGIGGAAQSSAMLYGARAVQGAFAAILAPAALSIIATTFTKPKERATAFSVYGAIAGGGAAIGLILGGVLTQYASWRWCLYVNIPIALMAAAGAVRFVRHSKVEGEARYDIPGAVLSVGGLVALVYGMTEASKPGKGWGSGEVIGLLAAAVVLLGSFVVQERRATSPLLPLRVPGDRTRGGSFLASLMIGGGLFAMFLFLTYYFQSNLGWSPLKSGFAFLPFSLGIIISAGGVSQLLPRTGPKPLMMTGLVMVTAGMLYLLTIGQNTSWAGHVLPAEVVMSLGMGMTFVPLASVSLIGVAEHDSGVASALFNTTQQIGGALGTAILSTIYASSVTGWFSSHPSTSKTSLFGIHESAIHGYHVAFLIGGIFAAIAFVSVTLLVRAGKDDLPAEGVVIA